MKNKVIVIFSSDESEEINNVLIKHIHDTIGVKHDVYCYQNFNQYSLSEVYNKAIKEHDEEDTIMVFCHNDIHFKTKNWGRILLTKFNNNDCQIIGLAGTTHMSETGVWWQERENMFGTVEHTDGTNTWISEYSKPRKGELIPVVVIDGLFMAVDCFDIVPFNEDFKGFHHYDTSFCIENYLYGNNIAVTSDIRVLHESIGVVNENWEKNRLQLIETYKDDLPLILDYD